MNQQWINSEIAVFTEIAYVNLGLHGEFHSFETLTDWTLDGYDFAIKQCNAEEISHLDRQVIFNILDHIHLAPCFFKGYLTGIESAEIQSCMYCCRDSDDLCPIHD